MVHCPQVEQTTKCKAFCVYINIIVLLFSFLKITVHYCCCFKCYFSFIHLGYFYTISLSPLLLRGAPDYSIDTVSELTR